MDADREPLAAWVERRGRRRESDRPITCRRRAELLDPAARGRAAHHAPDASRVLFEFDEESGEWLRSEAQTTPPPSSTGGDTTTPPEPPASCAPL
ncbi:hypothetical protein ACFCXH_31640 [Streptomyces nojiriensis]|uniref:hypothetical protein n=1 Tax=Streptomyces nojiriensis TaxID=66374 RepID=UPI0035E20D33